MCVCVWEGGGQELPYQEKQILIVPKPHFITPKRYEEQPCPLNMVVPPFKKIVLQLSFLRNHPKCTST